METMNIYLFTEFEELKAVIVAKSIQSATNNLQEVVNKNNEAEDYFQDIQIVPTTTGVGDWKVEIRENYKIGGEQRTLTHNAISAIYEVFELPFAFNKVYGFASKFWTE